MRIHPGLGQRHAFLAIHPALQACDEAFGRGGIAQRHQHSQYLTARAGDPPGFVHQALEAQKLLRQVPVDGRLVEFQCNDHAGNLGALLHAPQALQLKSEFRWAVRHFGKQR
ncbi:hypothetical protein D3C87_1713090 [compost metagenome]